jgi:hypothetical protein
MATTDIAPFGTPELARVLQAVEPAAFLVSPRILRRVIKQHRNIGGMSLLVPHRKSYVIDQGPLLKLVHRDELGLPADAILPDKIILLARPESDRLARLPRDEVLHKYWRTLFHARLDLVMQRKLDDGSLNAVSVRDRVRRLGETAFDEIGFVLRQEKFLLPPETAEGIYAEFVAVYLTLRRFAPKLVPHFFPGLHDLHHVDELVNAECDVDALYRATRLPGAPEPDLEATTFDDPHSLESLSPEALRMAPAPEVGEKTLRWLLHKAEEMDAKGNTVRAAILRTRAAEGANLTLAGARAELSLLSERMRRALELSPEVAEQWRKALLPLLACSARGVWTQEARFLYDLQRVCVDSERGIYTVDLVEWALSLGRRPLKRQLPGHQEVAIVRHLRRALGRMRSIRLPDGDRRRLMGLLLHAVEHREHLMRERFRPLLGDALDQVGLRPENVPEQIARAKLIEELLDRVVEFGHFNLGNLRDALSRNQLKLPDLRGPAELVGGDPLIRLNRLLAVSLDGVYRRGEIYMRWLHRVSSVAFGTKVGRLLMLYLVLPFGLAYFLMVAPTLAVEEGEKIGQMVGLVEKPPQARPKVAPETPEGTDQQPDDDNLDPEEQPAAAAAAAVAKAVEPKTAEDGEHHKHHGLPQPNWWGVAGLGVFFLLLFHVGEFRSGVFYGAARVGRGLQTVFITGPAWLLHQPALQALLHNRFWVLFRRCIFWPAAAAAAAGVEFWLCGFGLITDWWAAAAGFLVGILLLNTRVGRDAEETVTDLLVRFWLWLSADFVPGLLRFIMDASRWFLQGVEQVLYTVDEWLRFKSGESTASVAIKAVLGVVWFAVTYVIRIYVNLLIEPTVNPIKHFPVVTVGHKLMLPLIPAVYLVLKAPVSFLGPVLSSAFAGITILFVPGIFGFVVWELKENWKLYRSNRARNLKPVMIGSHGETMLRLLKPGFHSGTVPKLYRKLRRAERRGEPGPVRKFQAALHHVEESVRHFFDRELVALLRQSRGWGGVDVKLGRVHLATNRITAALTCSALGEQPLVLAFDHQNGWLLAGVVERGWLPRLSAEQRHTLAAALAGVYKMAGVHLTREQIEESLAPAAVTFDITADGLEVWPGPEYVGAAVYDLRNGPLLKPRPGNGKLPPDLPTLDIDRLLFSSVPVAWTDWVRTWDRDRGLVGGDRRELATALLPPAKAV